MLPHINLTEDEARAAFSQYDAQQLQQVAVALHLERQRLNNRVQVLQASHGVLQQAMEDLW